MCDAMILLFASVAKGVPVQRVEFSGKSLFRHYNGIINAEYIHYGYLERKLSFLLLFCFTFMYGNWNFFHELLIWNLENEMYFLIFCSKKNV